MEKYKLGEVIGSGCYGVVYKGHNLETTQTVAIKKLYSMDYYNGVPSTTIREISMLKELKHDNIVKLLDVISDTDNKLHIIFEYLDLDLEKYMATYPEESMDKQRIKNFMRQILSGIMHCHSCRIMHRDLKPDNLLLDLNASVVKIADFGMARAFQIPLREYSPQVITLWYRPPEILLGAPIYSTPIDVWSVGCIFAEMILHHHLFAGDSKPEQLRKIFSIMGTPNERTWPGVTSLPYYPTDIPNYNPVNLVEFFPDLEQAGVYLLSEMLCLNPDRRISAHQALEHAYFNNDGEEEEEVDDDDDDDDVH